MNFIGVEIEEDQNNESSLAIVNKEWLTPRKRELFWPPYKTQDEYDKAVKKGEKPNTETWELYKIRNFFFETDDWSKAKKKIKLAEVQSDVQSETEFNKKRPQRKPQRFREYNSDSDNSNESDDWEQSSKLPRPSIKQKTLVENETSKKIIPSINVTSCTRPCVTPSSSFINRDGNTTPTSSQSSSIQSTISTSSNLNMSILNEKKIIEYLARITEQNNQILNLMKEREHHPPGVFPEDIPVSLPLNIIEDVETLEVFLSETKNAAALQSYFATLGGRDLVTKTNTVLKRCLTNTVASNFNFYGKRNQKRAFGNLNLCKVIVDAVKQAAPQGTVQEIEGFIKCWLKHAPQRLTHETKNKSNN